MKHRDTILIVVGTVLCSVAFLTAFDLPKAFFPLALFTNVAACMGADLFFTDNDDYPLAFLMASLSVVVMATLGYVHAHIAYTYIPSAIVAGYVSATATRDRKHHWYDILFCGLMFILIWTANILTMFLVHV